MWEKQTMNKQISNVLSGAYVCYEKINQEKKTESDEGNHFK